MVKANILFISKVSAVTVAGNSVHFGKPLSFVFIYGYSHTM
jgi:hypothetical protein